MGAVLAFPTGTPIDEESAELDLVDEPVVETPDAEFRARVFGRYDLDIRERDAGIFDATRRGESPDPRRLLPEGMVVRMAAAPFDAPGTRWTDDDQLDVDRWTNEVIGALLRGASLTAAMKRAQKIVDALGPIDEVPTADVVTLAPRRDAGGHVPWRRFSPRTAILEASRRLGPSTRGVLVRAVYPQMRQAKAYATIATLLADGQLEHDKDERVRVVDERRDAKDDEAIAGLLVMLGGRAKLSALRARAFGVGLGGPAVRRALERLRLTGRVIPKSRHLELIAREETPMQNDTLIEKIAALLKERGPLAPREIVAALGESEKTVKLALRRGIECQKPLFERSGWSFKARWSLAGASAPKRGSVLPPAKKPRAPKPSTALVKVGSGAIPPAPCTSGEHGRLVDELLAVRTEFVAGVAEKVRKIDEAIAAIAAL